MPSSSKSLLLLGKSVSKEVYTLTITTVVICILYFTLYYIKNDHIVDPELYMNEKLTEAERLKVKIHASHHSHEDVAKLVQMLERGDGWQKAHSVLKATPMINHLSHVDTEIMTLFIECLTITTGLLFAYSIQSLYDIYTPNGTPLVKSWYNFLCFAFTILVFAIFTMSAKHYLSFRTFNESTFF